jgi:hypothetical protein
MKLLTHNVIFSKLHLFSVRSTYSPQRPSLKRPKAVFSSYEETKFQTHKMQWVKLQFCMFSKSVDFSKGDGERNKT